MRVALLVDNEYVNMAALLEIYGARVEYVRAFIDSCILNYQMCRESNSFYAPEYRLQVLVGR